MKHTKDHGQALVEFAIVIPVFMLLFAGMIQFGIILWGQNTLNQVVRDAGRFAATSSTCSASDARSRVVSLAGASGGPWTLVAASVAATYTGVCPPDNNQQQAWVKVAASADVAVFFPWLPGNGRISSSADFRVEPAP